MGIEKNGVCNMIGIFTVTADGNINIKTDVIIYYTERYRTCRTVFISHNFLGIKEIYPLILGCISGKGDTFSKGLKGIHNIISQLAIEDTGLCGSIISKFSCLRTDLNDLTLIHDDHTLSFIDSDHGTIGNDIFIPLVIGSTPLGSSVSLGYQYI